MPYELRPLDLNRGIDPVPLGAEEYDSTLQAKHFLQQCFNQEERFESVLANHFEWETAVCSAALAASLYHRDAIAAFDEDRRLLDRRLFNLLAISRRFVDQTKRAAKKVLGDDAQQLEDEKEALRGSHLDFRLMLALRNHVVHYHDGFGVTSVRRRYRAEQTEEGRLLHHSAVPRLRVDELLQDLQNPPRGQRPDEVLIKALESLGSDQIDLRSAARTLVSCLARIQNLHRDLRADGFEEHQARLEDLARKAGWPECTVGIFDVDEAGRKRGVLPLPMGTAERTTRLAQKNSRAASLDRHRIGLDSYVRGNWPPFQEP